MSGTRRARPERLWSVAEQHLRSKALPKATAAIVHDNFWKVGLDKGTIILARINACYPPTYVMSGSMNFLQKNCESMAQLLRQRGVTAEYKIYGEEGDETAGHVFHVNCRLPLAAQCNDEEAAFFKRFVR